MLSDWNNFGGSWAIAARVDYDEDFLDVKFKDGAICRYHNASEHYDGIVNASSAGAYVHQNLKNLPYEEVDD